MKMSKNGGSLPIKKEQLLSERAFIGHCTFDYHQNRKLDGINKTFLKAAEEDKFLEPMLQCEEDVIQEDGSKKKVLVNYYSPHQIFILTQLRGNRVNDAGKLESKKDFDIRYGSRETTRAITWGWKGMTFEIEYYRPLGKETSIFDICKDLHNFLRLLHSLDESRYEAFDPRKDRHFNDAPSLHFDYSPLKGNVKILRQYKLSLDQLKTLLKNVGYVAKQIDPLESWYYYIHRHPQWRKDLLKGEALLAQEIYILYDLISDVIGELTGKKSPPLFELLYGDQNIHPYLTPKAEYIHGTDIKSMWAAIEKFKEWVKKEGNREYVENHTLATLIDFEKELKKYEVKYKDRSFISNGIRVVEVEENIKLEELDPKTRLHVDQIIQQVEKEQKAGNHRFLSSWDDELAEQVKKKEITLDEAKKRDRELFIKREIFDAIETRLSELRRELWKIFDAVHDKISKNANVAWEAEHNFGSHFWFKKNEILKNLSRPDQMKLYKIEHDKVYEEAQHWSKKRDEFGQVQFIMELLFCKVCRKQPVMSHQSYHDAQLTSQTICDECVNKSDDRLKMSEGEIHCDYCDEGILFKFAHGNIISNLQVSGALMNLQLEYGRLKVNVRCKRCKNWNIRFLDWGWVA